MIPKSIQSLSLQQWWWVACACLRLIVVQIRIKLKQQSWLRSKLAMAPLLPSRKSSPPLELELIVKSPERHFALSMHEAVRIAARIQIWSTACLPRSIVLAEMLLKRGHQAQLMLGVSKANGVFSSHAWVELNGQPVGEPEQVGSEFSAFNNEPPR